MTEQAVDMNLMHDRIRERIGSMGLSQEAQEAKLARYAELFGQENVRLSALSVHNIAEDLMTTFYWVVTGEQDEDEPFTSVRNILVDGNGTGGDPDWQLAEAATRDVCIAYLQVPLGPSGSWRGAEEENAEHGIEKLKKLVGSNSSLDFFGLIEKCFGVDVFLLSSSLAFDAIGGMVKGNPFIVANLAHNSHRMHYAVAYELGKILAGEIYRYSDVYSEDSKPNQWVSDFVSELLMAFGMETIPDEVPVIQRFPKRLIDAHRAAVEKGTNPGYFLSWMTGEPVRNVLPHINADHLIDLMD